jgi:hypothetical protein
MLSNWHQKMKYHDRMIQEVTTVALWRTISDPIKIINMALALVTNLVGE